MIILVAEGTRQGREAREEAGSGIQTNKNKTVGWGPSPWTLHSKTRFETQAGRAPLVV